MLAEAAVGGGGAVMMAVAAAISKEAAKAAISLALVKSIVEGLSKLSPPASEGKEVEECPGSVLPKPNCATAYAAPRWLTLSCIQARSRPRLLRCSGLGSSDATVAENCEGWSSSSATSSVSSSGLGPPLFRLPPSSL